MLSCYHKGRPARAVTRQRDTKGSPPQAPPLQPDPDRRRDELERRFNLSVVPSSDCQKGTGAGRAVRLVPLTYRQNVADAPEDAHRQIELSDALCEKTKKRCVGSLDDKAVYFIGSRSGFHLAVECFPGEIRRLSEMEHLRFKRQSRVAGLCYGQFWEEERPQISSLTG